MHLASRNLAWQAWERRDLSAAHNLNWILQEVRVERDAGSRGRCWARLRNV